MFWSDMMFFVILAISAGYMDDANRYFSQPVVSIIQYRIPLIDMAMWYKSSAKPKGWKNDINRISLLLGEIWKYKTSYIISFQHFC